MQDGPACCNRLFPGGGTGSGGVENSHSKTFGKNAISVRIFHLSEPLQPYFTALYATSISCPPDTRLEDYLHPEGAALRMTNGTPPVARVGPGRMVRQWPFTANGPTSRATHFGISSSRVWVLGLQPAGWAKFMDTPADELADLKVDGSKHPAFAAFAPLLDMIRRSDGDSDRVASLFDQFLMAMADREVPAEQQILACQEALRDPEIAGVAELGERIGMTPRSLERLCRRYFGFPPKLLLRRQRFLRSLAQFMSDPTLTWSSALDGQYHDQAQFVREFRSFMGLTPGKYASMPHPILEQVMHQRMSDQGAAPAQIGLSAAQG